jgi:hypothetical protein
MVSLIGYVHVATTKRFDANRPPLVLKDFRWQRNINMTTRKVTPIMVPTNILPIAARARPCDGKGTVGEVILKGSCERHSG